MTLYALDDICDTHGDVAAGYGQQLHDSWIHPHPACHRHCCGSDKNHPGAQTILTVSVHRGKICRTASLVISNTISPWHLNSGRTNPAICFESGTVPMPQPGCWNGLHSDAFGVCRDAASCG